MSVGICIPWPNDTGEVANAIQAFAPDDVYVIGGVPGGEQVAGDNPFVTATDITDCSELPDVPIVVLAPPDGAYVQGQDLLTDFVHPTDCIYVFGKDIPPLTQEDLAGRGDHFVCVPYPSYVHLYAAQTIAVVLWDRVMKSG